MLKDNLVNITLKRKKNTLEINFRVKYKSTTYSYGC